jgi:glycosyltransferase involved in cell wall biosynthesis
MKTTFLSNKIPWFGLYTGYERLPLILKATGLETQIFSSNGNILERLVGKTYSMYRGWSDRNSYDTAAELRFSLASRGKSLTYHILYLENHLQFLDQWDKAPKNIIGTIHLPPSQWNSSMLENLQHLSSAIILYQRDLEFFESYVGKGRIHFIHYGVDTDFFHPLSAESPKTKRILFAGHYLRNKLMLYRVIIKLLKKHPELQFDLLVPEHARNTEGLLQLLKHPAVTWHKNLTDEALRYLYQTSYLLLLPMNESGANTAIVESLACGLPIITTDVGGIRDYGGADIFPIVANDDDNAMIDLVEKYLDNPDLRNKVAISCRNFAEQKLAWSVVAQKHLEVYKKLS